MYPKVGFTNCFVLKTLRHSSEISCRTGNLDTHVTFDESQGDIVTEHLRVKSVATSVNNQKKRLSKSLHVNQAHENLESTSLLLASKRLCFFTEDGEKNSSSFFKCDPV